ncbi:MAG: hypothetical protein EXQ49_10970 [Acidobacteria bacterium]|nr:hypothetical protein [Acidobacteriota bacterium]
MSVGASFDSGLRRRAMCPETFVIVGGCILRALRIDVVVGLGLAALIAAASPLVHAQLPFAVPKASGQTVTPAFEGWYRNADGTFNLSFGYNNRNSEEVVSVPIGVANTIAPGAANQGQPTEFQPGRHWGVFAVKVPADFGSKEVTWTVAVHGATYAIPGFLRANWQIDALEGEAGSGNTPPALKFAAKGPEGSGPLGITAGPVTASVAAPFALTVWARDDGKASGSVATSGRGAVPVTLTFFKHQGPGRVTFTPPSARIPATGGETTTQAAFSEPGEYMVRVRANDASGVAGAGHAQCCWTNGFVKVVVK